MNSPFFLKRYGSCRDSSSLYEARNLILKLPIFFSAKLCSTGAIVGFWLRGWVWCMRCPPGVFGEDPVVLVEEWRKITEHSSV